MAVISSMQALSRENPPVVIATASGPKELVAAMLPWLHEHFVVTKAQQKTLVRHLKTVHEHKYHTKAYVTAPFEAKGTAPQMFVVHVKK